MESEALREQAKYDVIWRELPSYRDCSPGEIFASYFFDGFKGKMRPGQTIIDFGCGTARVAKSFLAKGLNVTLVDISPYSLDEEVRNALKLFSQQIEFVQACLWQLPPSLKSAYWIYCCDVLEHIPEEKVDEVLAAIAERMRFGGYFSICLKEDLVGKEIGLPLHLTVKERGWWEERISKYFMIASEDVLSKGLYFNCRVTKK